MLSNPFEIELDIQINNPAITVKATPTDTDYFLLDLGKIHIINERKISSERVL
jgi:hypothetical protein